VTGTDETIAVRLDTPLMTADEVSALLRVPTSTIYDLSRRSHDRLPSIKVGRRKLFYRHDVESWASSARAA